MIFILSGCGAPENAKKRIAEDSVFYQPKYARGFEIRKNEEGHYQLVLQNPSVSGLQKVYAVGQVPQRLVCLSTTHLAFMEALGLGDKVIGAAGIEYISSAYYQQRIADGRLAEVGKGGNLDTELLLVAAPDMLIAGGMSTSEATLEVLEKAGITVINNLEWQENTPLGRAEWIVFMAFLLGVPQKGIAVFESIEADYLQTKAVLRAIAEKPVVMAGMSFQGVWYVPGGESFVAAFIKDAGGAYLWQDVPGNASVQLGFEKVYAAGNMADVWVNLNQISSLQELLEVDERLGKFKPVQKGKVFNNNLRLNQDGWNDYYESSVVNPHLVLSDLAAIFHPQLFPAHTFYYYKPVR